MVAGALLLAAGAVVFAYLWGSRREEKPVAPLHPVPPDVHQRVSGYTFTRSDEGWQVFTIHAARTVAFKQGGTTVLEDVYVEMFGRNGDRRDVLRTRRCDYNPQSGDFFSSGKVQFELNAGLDGDHEPHRPVMLETSQLYFRQQGSLVASDGPVRFQMGPITGSAVGMSYATKAEWLQFNRDVDAEMKTQGSGELPVKLTAVSARYDKQKAQITLNGPVEITQSNRLVQAAHGEVFLDDRNQVRQCVLEGGVRATEQSPTAQLLASAEKVTGEFDPKDETLRSAVAEGAVQVESRHEGSVNRMNAQRLEAAFAGKNPRAQRGLASGDVRLSQESLVSDPAAPAQSTNPGSLATSKKELTAGAVQFGFMGESQSLKDAQTVGPGRLLLVPSDPKLGERIATAGQFLMRFGSNSRLDTLRGEGGTKLIFQPAKDAPPKTLPQETTADQLLATFDPTAQTFRTLEQIGNFHFREGDRQAAADRASYQTPNDTLTLTGKPRAWDTTMRARADKILLDIRTDTVEGFGNVQSTQHGEDQGDPTSVLADHVVAQHQSQTVHYEGHVRAWRGADVVESAALDVFRSERRVSSGRDVLSSHLQPGGVVQKANGKAANHEDRPATIRADRLDYFDEGRKATYHGHVRLQTEDTVLESNRLDAYFSKTSSASEAELERAVADGDVKVTQPGRRATGQHAEYYASEGKILLSGGSPTLYDAAKGFTSGPNLTFYTHDDRLVVSGGEKSPTVSKHRVAH